MNSNQEETVRRNGRAWALAVGLSIAVTAIADAQQRTVSGRVSSAISNDPVAGATVVVQGGPGSAVTRAEYDIHVRLRTSGVS